MVLAARAEAFDLGMRFATDQALEAGYRTPTPARPGYAPDSVRTTLRECWRGQEPWEGVATRLEGHVLDASRQAVMSAAFDLDEPAPDVGPDFSDLEADWADLQEDMTPLEFRPSKHGVIGWARVLGKKDNHCAFCIVACSRGPVYSSAEAAGQMSASQKWADATGFINRYHDNCDCKVVLVTKGVKWEGRAQQAAMERLYELAVKRVKKEHPGKANGKLYSENYILKEIDKILRERVAAGTPVNIPAYAA